MKKRTNPYATSIPCCNNKRRRNNPEVVLPRAVFESIFERLPLVDIARAKAVSSSWKSSAESLPCSHLQKAPWLLLPPKDEEEETDTQSCRFKNIEENIAYFLKMKTSDLFFKLPCIGSSNGWLVLLDHTTFTPFLFNPFTEVQIQLPSLKSLFHISEISQTDYGDYEVKFGKQSKYIDLQCVRHSFVSKAISSAEPVGDYCVVLIYNNNGHKLGYFRNGDKSWTEFDNSWSEKVFHGYEDIICFNNMLYAVDRNRGIRAWDLQSHPPVKRMDVTPAISEGANSFRDDDGELCNIRSSYLVESEGKFILVDKFVREGEEILDDCLYRTEQFRLYELDLEGVQWVKLNSLGDRSLFLGGNHSISISTKDLPTCKRNSIYFTDDYWIRMLFKEWSYGHDNGIYSLEDGSCSPIYGFESENVHPLPCWIVPNSCKFDV
ncbi:hypothetical protein SLA2020_161130 [Shorea laevis]